MAAAALEPALDDEAAASCSANLTRSTFSGGTRTLFGLITLAAILLFAKTTGLRQLLFSHTQGFRLVAFFFAASELGFFLCRLNGVIDSVITLDEGPLLLHFDLNGAGEPEASACLISVVDLRVSVIFLRSAPAAEPWAVRRCSSRRSLSASVSMSSGAAFCTPADCS